MCAYMSSSKLAWGLFFSVLLLSTQIVRSENEDAHDDDDDEYEDVNRALLILRKSLKEEVAIQGRNVTVFLDIYNAGSMSAKFVKLSDKLPENAKLLDGSTDASFPVIAEGSSVKHSYVMTFTAGGGVLLPQASVSYLADDKSTQTGHSTTQGVYVMTPVQQIIRYALITGTYASLGLARTPEHWRNIAVVGGLVALLLGGNWVYKASSSAAVSRKRSRALQELEKSE
ncbi:hypothetical protein CEUSTIGMA_g5254.t1 [Chlamydomonas eustigma]|uniref:Translocon-associated protein subunit beta n=1 Tax=Chlamydomonas eustigma TaxID=1157962 RepID=A0A250X419_9CHLO|nr:hypothetical protein CEUSTIGMA_g5254.t1 [Chlamydomonas eustigma]|eukprot:GAX77811.1 hypothetical protein CEUSTIGMA_g5254.t1 [Chlamydomonas eustigma]